MLRKKKVLLIITVLIILFTSLMFIIINVKRKTYILSSNNEKNNMLLSEEKNNNDSNTILDNNDNNINSINISEKYIDTSIVTEEYNEYMNLPEEEKKNVSIIPRKHPVSKELFNDKYFMSLYEPKSSLRRKIVKAGDDSQYDLRNNIGQLDVENQGTGNLCWAYTANKVLETNIRMNSDEIFDFSENYLNYILSMDVYGSLRNLDAGGWPEEAINFYSAKGATTESVVENNKKYNKELIKSVDCIKRVKQYCVFPHVIKNDSEEVKNSLRILMKEHLKKYGGISTIINSPMESLGYSRTNNAFCSSVDTVESINSHSVTIIGWKDDFSKDNFDKSGDNIPQNDGAWLVLNSWGTDWGENGCFWISYEDPNIYEYLTGVISTVDTHPYTTGYEYNTYYPDDNFTLKPGNVLNNSTDGKYVVKFDRKKSGIEFIDYIVVCGTGSANVKINKDNNMVDGEFTINLGNKGSYYIDAKNWLVFTPDSNVKLDGENFAIYVDFADMDYDSSHYGLYATNNSSGSTYKLNQSNNYELINNDIQVIVYTHSYELKNITMNQLPLQYYNLGQDLDISNGKINANYLDGTTIEIPFSECEISGYNSSKEGTQEIIVNYKGKTLKYNVTVLEPIENNYTTKISQSNNITYLISKKSDRPISIFKHQFAAYGNIEVYDKQGQVITENNIIKTGMLVNINKENENNNYILIVNGDISGDGKVDIKDIIRINNYRLYGSENELEEINKIAGDVNEDNKLDIKDMIRINNQRLYGDNT